MTAIPTTAEKRAGHDPFESSQGAGERESLIWCPKYRNIWGPGRAAKQKKKKKKKSWVTGGRLASYGHGEKDFDRGKQINISSREIAK